MNTGLIISEKFFTCTDARVYKCKDSEPESTNEDKNVADTNSETDSNVRSRCVKSFQTFSEVESHLVIGNHCVSLYDKLRNDGMEKVTTALRRVCETSPSHQSVEMGWALP